MADSGLPLPPSNTPLLDPGTGTVAVEWQFYFLELQAAISALTIPPIDARYVVATANASLTNETNLGALATGYLKQTTTLGVATPSTVTTIPAADISAGAALTKVDDTNVTLTLGGTPASALLAAVSLTLGWTSLLSLARGGTGANLSATGGAGQVLQQTTVGGPVTVGVLSGSSITGAALTRVDDTNVTLALGGSPSTALLNAASLTLSWTGLLGLGRGGTAADLSATGGTSQVLRQSSAGAVVTVSQLALSDIAGAGTTEAEYGAGAAYAFTNTAAAIDFGTTDPAIVIGEAGTYLLFGQVLVAYNGATVVAETATVKFRRTNNTAADVGQPVIIDLPVATTLTHSYGTVSIPPTVYTTANTDDALTLFANVSAGLGAGTIDATARGTSIVALRIV